MTLEKITPIGVDDLGKKSKFKAQTTGGKFNSAMLGAIGASEGTVAETMRLYGDPKSSTVISAAFSGINQYNAEFGGSVPTMAYSGGFKGMGVGGDSGNTLANLDNPLVPGENFSQMDLINTMNQNNLELLTLQATMQSNMQQWNTNSNIIASHHRTKMAMIEKLNVR